METSNGETRKSLERASDTMMVDAPSESPFALLNQPKLELFDAIPATTAPTVAKPRFEPKVKPRGPQAKSRVSKLAPLPPRPETLQSASSALSKLDISPNPSIDVKLSEAVPPRSQNGPSDSIGGETFSSASTPGLVKVKTESLPKVKLESDVSESMLVAKEEDTSLRLDQEFLFGAGSVPKQENQPQHADQRVKSDVDRVVREIDVFVSRSVDPDTQLYLLQYPLRPAWRPYGLEEQCQEVRVKAVQKKLELDLAIDVDTENYDPDAAEHLQIKKQTLSSSKIALTTSYAIGVLQGNKLHLNPLQAVVQLRPSMKYLDEAEAEAAKKKQGATSAVDGDEEMADSEPAEATPELVALQVNVRRRETEWQEENRLHSHGYLKQLDEAEPWIPLEPHGVDSPVTDAVRCKMIASSSSQIPFKLRPDDYIKKLVPGHGTVSSSDVLSGDGSGSAGFSRSFLNTLPLEKRFHLLLSKGRVHVLQFERLMKLAPDDCTEQDVLNVLQEKAVLVQGCWVAASSLRFSKPVAIIRDYLLLLFTRNRVVQHSQLEDLRISKEILREILLSFAIQSGVTASWEFQESTDRSFIKRHQTVVKEQAQRWAEVENHLRETVKGLEVSSFKAVGKSHIDLSSVKEVTKRAGLGLQIGGLTKPFSASEKAKGVQFNLSADGNNSPKQMMDATVHTSLSEATLAALPGALHKIFMKHNVCRLQFICQSLRAMAIVAASGSSKDPSHQVAVEEAKAAAKAASAPLPELEAAVSKVASNIDGVYFLTSLGNGTLDPFRNVVIALLRAKGPGSGLRKTDIMEASKLALKTEVPQAVYQKVLKELCYTKGGAWVLKPGDGRPA